MRITVDKSNIAGVVQAPSSKSMTIRGLMCAALAKGESEIINPLVSEDSDAAINVLAQIGVNVRKEANIWRVTGGSLHAPQTDLYCGESATTLRFMTAICALIPGKHRLVGGPSLTKRPVRSLVEALRKLGVPASMEGKTTPPVIIEGGHLKGNLTELPGNVSSQFISALLLIAPFTENELSIRLTTQLTSRPYVLMTLRCLRQFGITVRTELDKFVIRRQRYTPTRFEVEGDWSSASYFLALGAISDGITVENLRSSSLQGDRVILDYLRSMGVQVKTAGSSISVGKGELRALQADFSDCIDLLPTMAVLAALANGRSEFTGIERARIKESNRVTAVVTGLKKIGVTAIEDRDRLTIMGLMTPDPNKKSEEEEEEESGEGSTGVLAVPAEPENVVIDSYNDHRIAMAFGVLGAAHGGITIDGAECVAKTFPDYWDQLKSVGGELQKNAE
jgi:3-phosphoshikimate 1-carboxyvinyltransferase